MSLLHPPAGRGEIFRIVPSIQIKLTIDRDTGEITAGLIFNTFITGGVLGVLAASVLGTLSGVGGAR